MGIHEAVVPVAGTASGRVLAFTVAADIHRLLLLDDLWTDLLERARRGDDTTALDDRVGMEALVVGVEDGLEKLRDPLSALRFLLDATPRSDFAEALDHLAADPAAPAELVERLAAALDDYEFRAISIEACDYVLEEIGSEIGLLRGKATALRDGRFPEGDFRLTFRCALFLAGAGATVAGTIGLGGTPALVGLVAFGSLTSTVLSWETNCGGQVPAVTRERR